MELTKLTLLGNGGYGLPRTGALQDKVIRLEPADGTPVRLSDLTEAQRRSMGVASVDREIVDLAVYDPGAEADALTADAVVITYPDKSLRPFTAADIATCSYRRGRV